MTHHPVIVATAAPRRIDVRNTIGPCLNDKRNDDFQHGNVTAALTTHRAARLTRYRTARNPP